MIAQDTHIVSPDDDRQGAAQAPAVPLESRDVIELQAFIRKKEWIQDKIKFLEALPPVEVFVGADDLATNDRPARLPSHDDVKRWIEENSRLEEETEQFDAGDMKRLKQTAKAASQRNLTPEDTDLIELTLMTLLALDTLLHLLRTRSELLDLMALRLKWEDQRLDARQERQAILDGARSFIVNSARWSPSPYEDAVSSAPSTPQLSSTSGHTPSSSQSSFTIPRSRSERFRLAERLSSEAAHLASRISVLRHTKVAAADTTLNRMIDVARKPVPDTFLDEQDRIEDDADAMEGLGKFALQVVVQWKRADESFNDWRRDQADARALLVDIEKASAQPPTHRLDASFTSRSASLVSKLSRVSDPLTSRSFPKPVHASYPDQPQASEQITRALSAELSTAKQLARLAASRSQEYHSSMQLVRRAETQQEEIVTLRSRISDLRSRLESGSDTFEGSDSPPDLSTPACLERTRHVLYLERLPAMMIEVDQLCVSAAKAARSGRVTLTDLKRIPVDCAFLDQFIQAITTLEFERTAIAAAKVTCAAAAEHLRSVQSIWNAHNEAQESCLTYGREIRDCLHVERWKPSDELDEGPLTPDTPSIRTFTLPSSPEDSRRQLDALANQVSTTITVPLKDISPHLGWALREHMNTASEALLRDITALRDLVNLWDRARAQASAMKDAMDEADQLESQVSSLSGDVETLWQEVCSGTLIPPWQQQETMLQDRVAALRRDIVAFNDGLASRIPLISSWHRTSDSTSNGFSISSPYRRSSMSLPATPPDTGRETPFTVPFDPDALDDAIRSHVNVRAANLAGASDNLDKRMRHIALAGKARQVDDEVERSETTLQSITEELRVQTDCHIPNDRDRTGESADKVQSLLDSLDKQLSALAAFSDGLQPRVSAAVAPAQALHQALLASAGADDSSIRHAVIIARDSRVRQLLLTKDNILRDALSASENLRELRVSLSNSLEALRKAEVERLEAARLEAEARARADAQARARREAEEEARVKAEEQLRVEAARRAQFDADEKLRLEDEERDRAEAESARLAVEEEERLREEERRRVELEALMKAKAEEEARLRAEEQARLAAVEAARLEAEERARLEAEERTRLEAEERARAVEEQARREGAERERLEAEERERLAAQERQRIEAEDRARLQALAGQAQREEEAAGASPKESRAADEEENAVRLDADVPPGQLVSEGEQQQHENHGLVRSLPSVVLTNHTTSAPAASSGDHEDVFGRYMPIGSDHDLGETYKAMHDRIAQLHNFLLGLNLRETAYPTLADSDVSALPTVNEATQAREQLNSLGAEAGKLRVSDSDNIALSALESLQSDITTSLQLLPRIQSLASFAAQVQHCDSMLSALLEQIDSYRGIPSLSSEPGTDVLHPARDELSRCLVETSDVVQVTVEQAESLKDDVRVKTEVDRVQQTWGELREMGQERLDPSFERSHSAASSFASLDSSYSINGMLGPPRAKTTMSRQSSQTLISDRSSNFSTSTNPFLAPVKKSTGRSVSGPTPKTPRTPVNRLPSATQAATFASAARQRTMSTASSATSARRARESMIPTPTFHRGLTDARSRKSSFSIADLQYTPSRPRNPSVSSWARTPRQSFGSPMATPRDRPKKNAYVANPKNKLDIAVGDVINRLPVNVKIEAIPGWKDQSGKYWIGEPDPKLCFCRILRSQTVMVRVGGGWMELSKFIKSHFADLFRLLPPGPVTPVPGNQERWISSATLLNSTKTPLHATGSPIGTPLPTSHSEPRTPLGSGQPSPLSVASSSPGSPLGALQFMRRAEESHSLQPPSLTARGSMKARTPARGTASRSVAWRP